MKRILFRRTTERSPPKYSLISRLAAETVDLITESFSGQPFGFDFETSGLDPVLPDSYVRSIGLANDEHCLAIDLKDADPAALEALMRWLGRQQLVAHNINFDGGWIYKYTAEVPRMECCTSGLFKQLSTEGYVGQRWRLKEAMVEILGWPLQNDRDLLMWLKENGLGKSDMAQAPWEILGPYNALDAAATFQLWQEFKLIMARYPWGQTLMEYHQQEFLCEVGLLIESQFAGLSLDIERLDTLDISLENKINGYLQEFMELPKVVEYRDHLRNCAITTMSETEPNEVLKDGKTISKNWLAWCVRMENIKVAEHFNIDSPSQLVGFFHKFLAYKVVEYTKPPKKPGKKPFVPKPSVGKRCLPFFEEYGEILIKYRLERDRRKFVKSLKAAQFNGRLHPRFKTPGTLTGRLSGGVEES